jgi:4-hydroxybenzoate polyprenyltransferase
MLDRRRKRLIFLFLGNVASGVVAVVVIFFGVVWTGESGPLGPLLIIVAVPAAGTSIWRADLEHRGRERDLAKRVAWQAFRVLIAWEAAALVIVGIFLFFALSAMAPIPHSHDTAGVVALILIPAVVVLALWFTWTRSRRMLDLLWPLPGMPQRGSESPHLQLKL